MMGLSSVPLCWRHGHDTHCAAATRSEGASGAPVAVVPFGSEEGSRQGVVRYGLWARPQKHEHRVLLGVGA